MSPVSRIKGVRAHVLEHVGRLRQSEQPRSTEEGGYLYVERDDAGMVERLSELAADAVIEVEGKPALLRGALYELTAFTTAWLEQLEVERKERQRDAEAG